MIVLEVEHCAGRELEGRQTSEGKNGSQCRKFSAAEGPKGFSSWSKVRFGWVPKSREHVECRGSAAIRRHFANSQTVLHNPPAIVPKSIQRRRYCGEDFGQREEGIHRLMRYIKQERKRRGVRRKARLSFVRVLRLPRVYIEGQKARERCQGWRQYHVQ